MFFVTQSLWCAFPSNAIQGEHRKIQVVKPFIYFILSLGLSRNQTFGLSKTPYFSLSL